MPKDSPLHPGPALARLLDDEAQALAGYPVRTLVQAWLTPKPSADRYMDPGAGRLLVALLQRWTANLAGQLSVMTQGGTLALEQVCHRTRASHRAMVQLLALVEQATGSGAGVAPQAAGSNAAIVDNDAVRVRRSKAVPPGPHRQATALPELQA